MLEVMLLADGIADVAVIAEVVTTQESGHGIDEIEVIVLQIDVDDFHSRRRCFGRTRNHEKRGLAPSVTKDAAAVSNYKGK